MKTERRHELEQNALADWLAARAQFIQHYMQAIIASVLAIVVVLGAWSYMSRRAANQEAVVWQKVFAASGSGDLDTLQRLADQNSSTTAGQWARLRLADQKLDQGINESFGDRPAAQKALAAAVDNYRALIEKSGDLERKQRAMVGLGRAYESQDKLPEAREEYEQLVKKWPDTVYGKEARDRLTDLDKQGTRQFYDWFAEREMKPADSSAVPGMRPKFDASALPNEGDFKFEHAPTSSPAADARSPGEKATAGEKGAAASQATKPADDESSDKK